MAMHLEFVVLGPPISNQQSTLAGKANLAAWRAAVRGRAQRKWPKPWLAGELKAIIINFYSGAEPPLDLDNMAKPILDAMQSIVYRNDRQVTQAEISHLRIDAAFPVVGVRRVLLNALRTGEEFVYVRLEDPANPFPLPR